MLLTICNEAVQPVIENAIMEYGLPLPNEVPSLGLKTQDVLGLALLPWHHGQNKLFYGPPNLSDHTQMGPHQY